MLFVSNSNTNVFFLVNSGSEISVLLKELTNEVNKYLSPQIRTIQSFDNKTIHPIGSVAVQLRLRSSFWVTQDLRNYGIIGLDMLVTHQLAIFPFFAQLCKMGSGRSAKLFASTHTNNLFN